MLPTNAFKLTLLLLAAVVGLEVLARRIRLPPSGAFVLGGIALALVPGAPELQLDPDLALVLFLPPLLMEGAFSTVLRDFRSDLRVILQLAVGAVAFTTLLVGLAAHWAMPSLPWAACFALGAIVSPPDAVSAKAVLKGLRLPRRVVVMIEGESLLNDATGLVLFRFAVAAALTGVFEPLQVAAGFIRLAAGGVAAGLACGFAASFTIARLREPVLAIIVSLLTAWGCYLLGEVVHVSGVLCTVTCGMVLGVRQHVDLTASARLQASAVWGVCVFALESLVFILIGLSLRDVLRRLADSPAHASELFVATSVVVAVVIVARFLWIFPTAYLVRALIPPLRRRDPYPPPAIPLVMSWAGMRGVVTLAAALTLPEAFPGRDFILVASFAVILTTVLVQGPTLGPLIRLLRLEEGAAPASLTIAGARARLATAQFSAIAAASRQDDGTEAHPRLLEQYGYRARIAARFSDASEALAPHRQAHFEAVLAAIEAGRAEVLRMHREREIHDTVLHTLERELDLEETRVRGYLTPSEAQP